MHSWITVHIRCLQDWGLVYWETASLVWSPESCVKLCHSSSVLLCKRGLLESKSHWQLDRCTVATIWAARHHSNSPMHHSLSPQAAWKPHQCTSAWRHRLKPKRRNMFMRNQRGMSMSWMASDWNMVINQQSFIDQSIDQWRECFVACLKAKSKHSEHLLWCVSLWYVTVMTFKAYTTAVMNKLTYVSFHKVGLEQPPGEVVNFVAVLLQIYWSICVPKIMKILWGLTKLLQKY